MNHPRLAVLIAVATAVMAFSASTASASIGVGTTTPRIIVDQKLQPGGIYRLPAIPVMNTGTERADFKIFVDRASKQTERFVDPRWIQVSPVTTSLEASRSALIGATMYVPLMAPSGEYQALVVAQPVIPGVGANTPNVQVGTKVVFRVVQSNFFVALFWRIIGLLQLWAPWSYAALALAVTLPGMRYVAKRYRFSFAITRRP